MPPSQMAGLVSGGEAQREPCGEPVYWKVSAGSDYAFAKSAWKTSVSRSYKGEWAGGYEVDFTKFLDNLDSNEERDPVTSGVQHTAASWKELCREGPDACSKSSWETDDESFASTDDSAPQNDNRDIVMWAIADEDEDTVPRPPSRTARSHNTAPAPTSPLTVPASDDTPANQAKPTVKLQSPNPNPNPKPGSELPSEGPSADSGAQTPNPVAENRLVIATPPSPATVDDKAKGVTPLTGAAGNENPPLGEPQGKCPPPSGAQSPKLTTKVDSTSTVPERGNTVDSASSSQPPTAAAELREPLHATTDSISDTPMSILAVEVPVVAPAVAATYDDPHATGRTGSDSPNDDCFTTSEEAESKDSSPPRCAQPAAGKPNPKPQAKRKGGPAQQGPSSKRRTCLDPEDIS